jgi:hypothetical protein
MLRMSAPRAARRVHDGREVVVGEHLVIRCLAGHVQRAAAAFLRADGASSKAVDAVAGHRYLIAQAAFSSAHDAGVLAEAVVRANTFAAALSALGELGKRRSAWRVWRW